MNGIQLNAYVGSNSQIAEEQLSSSRSRRRTMCVGWLKNGKIDGAGDVRKKHMSTSRKPPQRHMQLIKPSADSRQPTTLYPYTFPLPVNLDAVDIISGDDTLRFCIRRCLLHPTDLTPTRNCKINVITAQLQPGGNRRRLPYGYRGIPARPRRFRFFWGLV